jgi:hypothetical protein
VSVCGGCASGSQSEKTSRAPAAEDSTGGAARAEEGSAETAQAAAANQALAEGGGAQVAAAAKEGSAGAAGAEAERKSEAPEPDEASIPDERKLIKEAQLRLDVDDNRAAIEAIEKLADRFDGYLETSSDDQITIRVDTSRLDDAVETIVGLDPVDEVVSRSITSRDVTDQMRDYEIRLDNKLEARERYIDLMQEADEVGDMLKIENELERLNVEIERLKGELKGLKKKVALSKITVYLRARDPGDGESKEPLSGFTPGLGYSALAFSDGGVGWVHGPTMELGTVSYRNLRAGDAPSHWKIFVELGLLNPTSGDAVPWLVWSAGFRTAFESAPARRWLIPNLGLELGQLFAPETPVFHLTPNAGLHVWSAENATANLEFGYFLPPGSLETRRGFRFDANIQFTFW